jgi:selenocysteine lyase/cysteine desulfurase
MTIRSCPSGFLRPPLPLVGDGAPVRCTDGAERPYLSLDTAASTPPLETVLDSVQEFLPWYSSVHRGAGHKSQVSTRAYEDARSAALAFAGREAGADHVAIICRNTTEAINHLAYSLRLAPGDVVVATVAEHHANMLPWSRAATCRYVQCRVDGTFDVSDVESALDQGPSPRLLAITGASNITGWMPPLTAIIAAAHDRNIPVAVDAAQLAPHRPLPAEADFLAWSGHKMYAPFGAGVLTGPRHIFAEGDPFLVGGGAVDLVQLDEVVWAAHRDGAAPRARCHTWRPSSRARNGHRNAAIGLIYYRRDTARAGGGPPGRRGGDRRQAWLLLRAPVPRALARPHIRTRAPLPGTAPPR